MIKTYMGATPEIHESAFVAETAALIGRVKLCENSSVWYGAVIRADEADIVLGKGTNVQDNCALHCDEGSHMIIGDNVTIGHGAVLHGATIGDNVLIGMGAIVLDGAKIGENCIIAAGALVKEKAVIPENSMVVGVPGKIVKTLTAEQIAQRKETSYYVEFARLYKEQGEARE